MDPSLGELLPSEVDAIVGFLILRHLHDGDVIDYPVAADHPHRGVFDSLEARGLVARWDRIWPLRDRYRLTDLGIAEIERQYDPATADPLLQELKDLNLPPDQRADWLRGRGYDPNIWPALHDPYNHWSTWANDPGPSFLYVHDYLRTERKPKPRPQRAVDDLDRNASDGAVFDPLHPITDVS